MGIERRQFPRLQLSELAYAVDDSGRELGKVSQASGGGMLIKTASETLAGSFKVGDKLRITIIEPGSQASNTIDIVIRYIDKKVMGVEFVTGQ
jgi:hypothetical protein